MPNVRYLSVAEVQRIHDRIIAATGGMPGVINPAHLVAAVERPRSGMRDIEFYPTVVEKAAALLHSIISTHPFADGNKRTSVAAAGLFLRVNGLRLAVSQSELEEFAVHVAVAHPEIADITDWLQQHTHPSDELANN